MNNLAIGRSTQTNYQDPAREVRVFRVNKGNAEEHIDHALDDAVFLGPSTRTPSELHIGPEMHTPLLARHP